jgi:hypothetical protein
VANGNILSARNYSDGSYSNYGNKIRSMIVSSGASPKAYILSNFQTNYLEIESCTG